MAAEALLQDGQETEINAAFMRNHRGEVCIAFRDPAYTRAEAILVDDRTCAVHALLHESAFYITNVSDLMARAMADNETVILTALRPDGSLLEMTAPVRVGNA